MGLSTTRSSHRWMIWEMWLGLALISLETENEEKAFLFPLFIDKKIKSLGLFTQQKGMA